MAIVNQPHVVKKMINDVVDLYKPHATMTVSFRNNTITNCSLIKPSVVADSPHVVVKGHKGNFYTLVMTDPDAPNPSAPYMQEYIHWIVTNIKGGSTASKGDEVLPYQAPCPIIGIHRYVFTLFDQGRCKHNVDPPSTRQKFDTQAFARNLNLGSPVATKYFNSRKEPACKKPRLTK